MSIFQLQPPSCNCLRKFHRIYRTQVTQSVEVLFCRSKRKVTQGVDLSKLLNVFLALWQTGSWFPILVRFLLLNWSDSGCWKLPSLKCVGLVWTFPVLHFATTSKNLNLTRFYENWFDWVKAKCSMLGSILPLAIFFIFASLTLCSSDKLVRVRATFQKVWFLCWRYATTSEPSPVVLKKKTLSDPCWGMIEEKNCVETLSHRRPSLISDWKASN